MADQNTPSGAIPIKVTLVDQSGAFLAGSAVTIADNGNAVEGSLSDAAIVTDTTGSLSGKIRGLVKWAFERMPASLGQKVMASSFPVVFASNQSPLDVSLVTSPIDVQQVGALAWHVIADSGAVTVTSTTLTATVQPAGVATVSDNRLTVAVAGTAQQFPSVAAKSVAVTAETDNTGYIVVGGSSVVAALATRRGIPLAPGDTAVFAVANLNELYIDTTVSTDGVTYVVLV